MNVHPNRKERYPGLRWRRPDESLLDYAREIERVLLLRTAEVHLLKSLLRIIESLPPSPSL